MDLSMIKEAITIAQQIAELPDSPLKTAIERAMIDQLSLRPSQTARANAGEVRIPIPLELPDFSTEKDSPPIPPSKRRKAQMHSNSMQARTLEYVRQLGAEGLTVTDLAEVVDADLRHNLARTMYNLWRDGHVTRVMRRNTKNSLGQNTDQWAYYPAEPEETKATDPTS